MGTSTYLFKQGYGNLKKHGSKTFSTMLIICATMIILGIFLIIVINVNHNVKTVTEGQGLQAFISEDHLEQESVQEIARKLKDVDNVKEIIFLNKDDALLDAKETLKEYAYLLEGLEKANPFPASFIVKFENLQGTENVKKAIESIDGIYKVGYNETIMNAVISVADIAKIVFFGIGGVMVIISIFIISNTIKLAVYSNKREIFIMRYIGATNKFIRRPFVVEGTLIGMGAAAISWVIVSLTYIVTYARLPKIGSTLGIFGFVPYSSLWYIILIAFVILGIALGVIGSSISIKKYLKA
ncbi:MAG: permease-like cell division protein FtsX [Clostridia bacterium]|nr:permease-like cell division protein FtsX [Clostridia bacterium]MDD4375211.1 permease-like cell division protein FtsX [Clostridia bacterium]